MFKVLLSPFKNCFKKVAQKVQEHFVKWTTPIKTVPAVATLANVAKTKRELIAENALLRKPALVLELVS